jgi:hypothetical protein
MSFRLSFHLAPLDATEPHQPDGAADLSCEDGTRQHATDGCPLSCKQQIGGSSPPPTPSTAGHRLSWSHLAVTRQGPRPFLTVPSSGSLTGPARPA